jgi:myosin-1
LKIGFAYKKGYGLFMKRYKSLCPTTWPNYLNGDMKMGSVELVSFLNYQENREYNLGK